MQAIVSCNHWPLRLATVLDLYAWRWLAMEQAAKENLQLGSDWFSEVNSDWPGNAFSLKVKEVICHEKSEFQDILIFER